MARYGIRRVAIVLLLGAAVAIGQWAFSAVAEAHAVLLSSSPADGQVLPKPPSEIDLDLSEAAVATSTRVDVTDSHGTTFETSSTTLRGSGEIIARPPTLPPGTYRVDWRTISKDDRHATAGSFVFAIGVAANLHSVLPTDPPPNALEVVLRWLSLVSAGGLVGGLALARLSEAPGPEGTAGDSPIRDSVVRAALVSGGAAILACAALDVVQAGGLAAMLGLLTDPFGARAVVRELSLTVLVTLAILGYGRAATRRRRRCTAADVVAVVAAALYCAAAALSGHAATSATRAVLESIHLMLALLWFGGLGTASVVVLTAIRHWRSATGNGESAELRSETVGLLRIFGLTALISVAGLSVTGILLTGDSVSTVDSLLMSTFGRILLVKLAVAFLAGLLGWRTHRRLRRALPSFSRRSLAVEAAVLAAVLLGAAALASSAPPQGALWRPAAATGGSVIATADSAGLVESLRLSPNVPGQNLVDFRVFDSRRPASGPIRAVGLTLRGPAGRNETTSTTQAAPGRWIVPTDVVSAPGRWAIIVRVSRDGRPDAVTDFTWSVGASVGFARRVVSQAQVAPLAGAAGAGLSVTLLALASAFLAGTRPRARRRVASENIVDGARSPSDESETTGLALTR